MSEVTDKSWRLEKLDIQYKSYGELKGKYVGTIKFENEKGESFLFNLTPEKADQFLKLIAFDLVITADELGKRLINSIGLDRIIDKK